MFDIGYCFFLLRFPPSYYNAPMLYIMLTILVLANACFLLLTLFALPGNWLIVIATAIFAYYYADDQPFSVYTIAAIVILALIGEIFEFFAGIGGAKKAGASSKGALGALLGAIIGAIVATPTIPIPILGTLIGACVGAGIGTWAMEIHAGKKPHLATRSGVGASIGVLIGTTTKLIIGITIWIIIAIAAFWP